ncbi:hypothetical protein I312_103583 [Cryptococcus bacillisporus CA1280]|uniref:uncharacterized protein n=1 Tax=Cryptococcus bacillisporus CA1280 TaxID=1296109 RepID=UPI0033671EC2
MTSSITHTHNIAQLSTKASPVDKPHLELSAVNFKVAAVFRSNWGASPDETPVTAKVTSSLLNLRLT